MARIEPIDPHGEGCWGCVCLHMAHTDFVDDAKCLHPAVVRAMRRKGVKTLDKRKLHKGCPFKTQSLDKVTDEHGEKVKAYRKEEVEANAGRQLSLI